ncbi:O-succinylbenzoic acid--CoA ligase [Propionibacterium cyclohexanicum]|uniref:O-succinylbenzoic acid--CoA ligase n=1 Tax=Propionibacterium cyclohexanicum TaxID=64702 RepID=A0A1H9QDF5_9ACTN|nr:AMP-binding protein [Propionibacterium cyclohexanicum]SER58442.1 O-succinylbenzoic acid--CoA ligase [Propionibacterium cyclohexanicum]
MNPQIFQILPVRREASDLGSLARALAQVFDGTADRILVPADPGEDPEALRADLTARVRRLPEDVRIVVRTSGSTTGHGRLVGLAAHQLRASAEATAQRLGGQGQWVLALPPHHIAGLQVVARSVLAGREPVPTQGRFSPAELARALDRALRAEPTRRVHLSLVPTQLADALRDPAATRALARAASVLVGGDATGARLAEQARSAGIALRRSYGMSETCGGCVYDGRPLRGVHIRLGTTRDSLDTSGRIWLGGPMVMSGYLDGELGVTRQGTVRWIATQDWGQLRDGQLVVGGRLDDVIVTGGLKVSAADVREAALATGMVREAAVVGLPNERWGHLVAAVLVADSPWQPGSARMLRDAIGRRIGRARAPRVVVVLDALPRLASGKTDRVAARRLAEEALRDGTAFSID